MSFVLRALFLGLLTCSAHANLSQDVVEMRSQLRQLQKRIDELESRVGIPSAHNAIEHEIQSHAHKNHAPQNKSHSLQNESNVSEDESSALGWNQGSMPKKIATPASEKDWNRPSFAEKKKEAENFSENFLKAKKFLAQGDIKKASALFKGIKPQESDYPHALYWLGMIALLQDRNAVQAATYFSKGYQHCESMPQCRLLSVSLLLKLANALYLQKKISAAKIVLGQCQERAQQVTLSPETQQEISALEKSLLAQ